MDNNFEPSLYKGAFICTHCNVRTPHKHHKIISDKSDLNQDIPIINLSIIDFNRGDPVPKSITFKEQINDSDERWNLHVSVCTYCFQYTIWENETIIFPQELNTPTPSLDMPEEVKKIYKEAQLVYKNSPRAASALLRLAIETLIPKLEYGIKQKKSNGKNKKLFEMIEELVRKDISAEVQKGLDAIRYYGNRGIHAAEIDMKDDRDKVNFLFILCNKIVKELITEKKEVNEFYDSIPEGFRSSVDKRDEKS